MHIRIISTVSINTAHILRGILVAFVIFFDSAFTGKDKKYASKNGTHADKRYLQKRKTSAKIPPAITVL